jgi:hypothetical protein
MPTLPYSSSVRIPTDPNRNRDLLGNVIDPAMEPDRGAGMAPPRDPYMDSLPPVNAQPAAQPVTRLAPGRTSPFSRADAQALAALDPRALDEAKGIAAMPESMPAKITGSFGGKNFEMQPSARVDRNALARLYAQAEQRKAMEREDDVRGQEQSGRERIVSIPGQQGIDKRKMELETEERTAGADREFKAPARDADIAAKSAQTAAAVGAEGRAGKAFDERITPEQEAIDAQLAAAEANPFARTGPGQARIRELQKRSTAGRSLPPEANQPAAPAVDVGEAAAEIMADPGITALIERAKATEAGLLTGARGRATGAAARQLAERAIRARLARSGATPQEAQDLITSILGAQSGAPSNVGSAMGTGARAFPGGGMIASAIDAASR